MSLGFQACSPHPPKVLASSVSFFLSWQQCIALFTLASQLYVSTTKSFQKVASFRPLSALAPLPSWGKDKGVGLGWDHSQGKALQPPFHCGIQSMCACAHTYMFPQAASLLKNQLFEAA